MLCYLCTLNNADLNTDPLLRNNSISPNWIISLVLGVSGSVSVFIFGAEVYKVPYTPWGGGDIKFVEKNIKFVGKNIKFVGKKIKFVGKNIKFVGKNIKLKVGSGRGMKGLWKQYPFFLLNIILRKGR